MLRVLLSIALCIAVSDRGPAQDKPKDDTQLVQGTWQWNPKEKQSDAQPQILVEKLVFKGTKLTFHYKFDDKTFTSETEFTLNPKGSPKEINFTPVDGANKGQTYLGLYEFQDGKLKICYRGPDSTRPKDFNDKNDGTASTSYIYLIPPPAG